MSNITLLAIDLAKNVFQLHGVNMSGAAVLKKKLTRTKLPDYVANMPKCTVAMEACGSANFWARKFREYGHEVKLISPQHVKPFVRGSKTDANDAQAIALAAQQPDMPTVPIKTVAQQDIQMIHRLRERYVSERTATSNQIRGFLGEYGVVINQGINNVRRHVMDKLEDASNDLTQIAREEIHFLYKKLLELDEKVRRYDMKIAAICRDNKICQSFMSLPGIGPVSSSIVFACMGDPNNFKNGKQFAAYLGLAPKEHSSGGKQCLLGISKRGNRYIRSLLIHGGRTVIKNVDKKEDKFSLWAKRIKVERGYNKASVAVANKNARHLWAMMMKGDKYVSCYN